MRAVAFPVVGPTTVCSPFGDPRGEGKTHHGIDLCAPMGTPVLAPDNGSVRLGHDPMGGNVALVDDDGGGTWYLAHLSAFNGEDRDVRAGDVVGFVGMTGNAGGTVPHVHVEAWPTGLYSSYVDPTPMLQVAKHFAAPPTGSLRGLGTGRAVVLALATIAGAVGLAYAIQAPRPRRRGSYRPRTRRA